MADCVTSLGGIELRFDDWRIDFAYSCSQKCLGAPPGLSPVAVSDRALERIADRTKGGWDGIPYSLDLSLLRKYWVERPLAYHHTTPVLNIYALHEALREVAVEGLEARWARHMDAGRFLQDEVRFPRSRPGRARAPAPPSSPRSRSPTASTARPWPAACCASRGSRSAAALAGAPPMWRIGLMGVNALSRDRRPGALRPGCGARRGARVRRDRVDGAGCRGGGDRPIATWNACQTGDGAPAVARVPGPTWFSRQSAGAGLVCHGCQVDRPPGSPSATNRDRPAQFVPRRTRGDHFATNRGRRN